MAGERDAFSYLFNVGQDVLHSGLDAETTTILCQLGDCATGVADSDAAELWQQPGFWSLPAAPTQGQPSCQTVVVKRSDKDIIIATRDLRVSYLYGNLQPGETVVGATAAQGRTAYKVDGSISHATTDDNTKTGNLVMRSLAPTGEGFTAPFGSSTHDATGWHLRTWHGAKVDIGGLGLPAPLGAFSSNMIFSADMINVDAALLSLGRDTGFTQAVVQALPLQVVMTELIAALKAINAFIDGVVPVIGSFTGTGTFPGLLSPIPPTVPPGGLTALTTLADSAIAAVNTALATIQNAASKGGCATNTTVA